jgi:hypothetical protein
VNKDHGYPRARLDVTQLDAAFERDFAGGEFRNFLRESESREGEQYETNGEKRSLEHKEVLTKSGPK